MTIISTRIILSFRRREEERRLFNARSHVANLIGNFVPRAEHDPFSGPVSHGENGMKLRRYKTYIISRY